MTDLAELRRLAEAATEEWAGVDLAYLQQAAALSPDEAAYIAAANPGTILALLDNVTDPGSEHCQECGMAVKVWWHAPDDLWASVTGREDGGGLRCIPCFDRAATERGHLVEWVPVLHSKTSAGGAIVSVNPCVCGHSAAEHDQTDEVDWPCDQCECDNFDERDEP